MLLPAVMRYNAPVTGVRLGSVAQALAAPGADCADAADRAIIAVGRLLSRLGVPRRLRDAGIAREAIPQIVEHTFDDWVITQVPRPVTREGLLALLDAAW
jgi:alcohol dehydrogenase